MYFSRIRFRPNLSAGEIARIQCRNPYQEHQQLWSLFADDPAAQRDFLFRSEPDCFYIVSDRQPRDQQGIWQIESKRYDPKPIEGAYYRFMLRVNPVVTRRDRDGKAHRHDIVMDAKKQAAYLELLFHERPSTNHLAMKVGLEWLKKRQVNSGFEVVTNSLLVHGYLQHRISRRGKSKLIRYSTLDFTGHLTVTDVDKLTHALINGIGPAKAFGCGLLSLARA